MVRQIDLIQYLPQFVADYKEIQHILDSENLEFQIAIKESKKIQDNQFIITCNEVGISKFEKLLNITPSFEDTLESRISRVLIRWNDSSSYTWKVFLQKLHSLCGTDFELKTDWENYSMEIITHLNKYGQLDEINNMIEYMIPANIKSNVTNKLDFVLKSNICVSTHMIDCKIIEIKQM